MFRYGFTFAFTFDGWGTNCFPAAFPARFARVVAAYSCGLNASIAFFGRYRSPVSDDFFPDLVVHFWSPQAFKERCDFANPLIYTHRQPPYIFLLLIGLYEPTIDLRQYHELQQP